MEEKLLSIAWEARRCIRGKLVHPETNMLSTCLVDGECLEDAPLYVGPFIRKRRPAFSDQCLPWTVRQVW